MKETPKVCTLRIARIDDDQPSSYVLEPISGKGSTCHGGDDAPKLLSFEVEIVGACE